MKVRKRVLVAEDNADTRGLLAIALRDASFDFQFAVDGQEALDLFNRARDDDAPFDFALLDIEMPKVNGFVVAEQILECDPQMNVVLCTAYNLEDVLPRARQNGVAEVWLKPFALGKLARRIACAMGE